MEEFVFYRKKFEKSQKAQAANQGDILNGKMGLNLTKEMFDPRNM